MTGYRILYISDAGLISDQLLTALRSMGFDVVNTSSPTQAIALLFLMYSAAGIVLSHQLMEHASFDVVHSLRAICPQIPILMLCDGLVEPVPSVDFCVDTRLPLQKLVDKLQRLLGLSQLLRGRCGSEARGREPSA